MAASHAHYIPAAGHRWLAPLYDPAQRLLMREQTIKERLVAEAHVAPGQRVLDLGCGTGTLLALLARQYPLARLAGLDADAAILKRARAKARRAGARAHLVQGSAGQLPYQDASFDRVLSSLVVHHLATEDKALAFREAFRILRPGGLIAVADFGRPRSLWARVAGLPLCWLEQARDNLEGRLPIFLHGAGFQEVREPDVFGTLFGDVVLYVGIKPGH
jgi:ubiquinone/menaquinone biosynthesis C-methylase UbiE